MDQTNQVSSSHELGGETSLPETKKTFDDEHEPFHLSRMDDRTNVILSNVMK